MALAKKTIKLLRRVEKKILNEPRRLNMYGWGHIWPKTYKQKSVPPCRTTACIAGWTVLLDRPEVLKDLLKKDGSSVLASTMNQDTTPGMEAGKILDIDFHQQNRLFFDHNWPQKYYDKYLTAKTAAGRARATVNRIEHFIKTDGME